jgi:hypothetical protein
MELRDLGIEKLKDKGQSNYYAYHLLCAGRKEGLTLRCSVFPKDVIYLFL